MDKNDGLKLKIGHVQSVSNPMPKYNNNQFNINQPFGQTEMVVDVTVKFGEEICEYKQLPANATIVNSGINGIIVSESREAMNAEVEGIRRNSQQVIESLPYHEKTIQECDEIVSILNPQIAKEKEQEAKIGALEAKMGNIEGTLSSMMGMLSNLVVTTSKSSKNEE